MTTDTEAREGTWRLSPQLYEALRQAAFERRESMNAIIVKALTAYLATVATSPRGSTGSGQASKGGTQ